MSRLQQYKPDKFYLLWQTSGNSACPGLVTLWSLFLYHFNYVRAAGIINSVTLNEIFGVLTLIKPDDSKQSFLKNIKNLKFTLKFKKSKCNFKKYFSSRLVSSLLHCWILSIAVYLSSVTGSWFQPGIVAPTQVCVQMVIKYDCI